ncbi:MAG: TAT-variant-translocated molybdopterin oxidoreductase [Bacteroidota bacterium]
MIELDILSKADVTLDGQPRAWRSPADKARTAESRALQQSEFHPDAFTGEDAFKLDDRAGDDFASGTSRRSFMKIMGASMAFAGLTGCRRPAEEILPYARKPEQVIPGVPNYYATSMPLGGPVQGILIRANEGRPTKVEGNAAHPYNQGATDVFAQASVLNLYDPDRSRVVRRAGEASSSWRDFVAFARQMRDGGVQGNVAVLAEPNDSPTLARLRGEMEAAYPGLRWITYRALGDDTGALGTQQALGRPLRPNYDYANADIIVSFDSDEMGAEHLGTIANQRGIAASRRITEGRRSTMSRIYLVESQMSPMAGMADHRVRMRAADIPHLASAVAARLGVGSATATGTALMTADAHAAPILEALIEDVQAAQGRVVFSAGGTLPPEVHALVAALNAEYGQEVVRYYDTGEGTVTSQDEALQALVTDMNAGAVGALVCLGTNPVYSAPAALGFADAMANVPVTIHAGLHIDETAQRATWHVPLAHYLEQWGDGRAYDGTLSPIQPTIAPLYEDAHSDLEIVNVLTTGRDASGYDLVRTTWRSQITGAFEDGWRTVLHDGMLRDTAYPVVQPANVATPDLSGLPVLAPDAMELVVRLSGKVYDGSYANNAWMQEASETVTKITWDNVAIMSHGTAEALGVNSVLRKGKQYVSVVSLKAGGETIEIPAWVQPGHPDNSVTVVAGYGRDLASDRIPPPKPIFQRFKLGYFDNDIYDDGPLANGIGANVAPLRPLGGRVAVLEERPSIVDEDYLIATTQDHGGLNVENATTAVEDRGIIRQTTLAAYAQGDNAAYDPVPLIEDVPWQDYPPIWGEERDAASDPRIGEAMYAENQWALSVDLNTCTGCNACVIACQSENNIQVVGKDQVSRGREMSWMRMDRYYMGDMDNPEMVSMPMMCQHCEYAPCEQVCPVNATVHSPDGTNAMIYNRCVGTRYCANNCPYKVRRYNFYNWTQSLPIEVQMAQNPNVTVRFRGVMEKCSFCIQRIRYAQGIAHIEDRPMEPLTACQQVCASQAITFGDIKDPDSAISAARRSDRNYAVLGYLNVKPRVTYQARITNPNPALAGPVEIRGGYDEHGGDGYGGDGDGGHSSDHAEGAVPGDAPAS